MKKDSQKTTVIFRKWNDDIIALFPYIIADYNGNVMSYQHIGQHGGADYDHIIKNSKPATEKEYKPLFNELTNLGYNLKVAKKINRKKYLNEFLNV